MSRHALLPISRGFESSIGVLSGGHDHITQRNPGQGCSSWSPTKPSGPCNPLKPPDQADAAANNCDGGVVDYWQSEMTVSASPPAQPCSEASQLEAPRRCRQGHPGEGGCTATACPVPNGTFEPYSLNARALSIVEAHDASQPLYLHYTPHMVHTPLERSPTMPDEFLNGTRCGKPQRFRLG